MHPSPISAPRITRRRKAIWIVVVLLVLLAWRLFPAWAIFTDRNLKGAIVQRLPSDDFLPPGETPDEVSAGLSHPGFDARQLVLQLIFTPRTIHHGHAFWAATDALDDRSARQLAVVLANPSTYEEWGGNKGCGGFHADWHLTWGSGESRREAMICEGCHEILLYHGDRFIRCDLTKAAMERISALTRTPGTR